MWSPGSVGSGMRLEIGVAAGRSVVPANPSTAVASVEGFDRIVREAGAERPGSLQPVWCFAFECTGRRAVHMLSPPPQHQL